LLRKGRSQDSRLERHAGYEQYRGMAAHLAGNGGLRRRYGLPYAPSKSSLHAMAASVAAAGKAFMGAVPAATVSGCHERRLRWSPDIGRCETPPEAIGKRRATEAIGKSDPKRMGAPMTRRNNFNTLQKRKRKGKTYWASILASQSGSSLGVPPDVAAVTC